MSAALSRAVPILAPFIVARDPDAPDSLTWLTLEQVLVAGDLVWIKRSAWASEELAQSAAGFLDSPAAAFLLHDPERGWLRNGGRGWSTHSALAGRFGRGEACEALRHFGPLTVRVVRINGRITHPTSTEFPHDDGR